MHKHKDKSVKIHVAKNSKEKNKKPKNTQTKIQ